MRIERDLNRNIENVQLEILPYRPNKKIINKKIGMCRAPNLLTHLPFPTNHDKNKDSSKQIDGIREVPIIFGSSCSPGYHFGHPQNTHQSE